MFRVLFLHDRNYQVENRHGEAAGNSAARGEKDVVHQAVRRPVEIYSSLLKIIVQRVRIKLRTILAGKILRGANVVSFALNHAKFLARPRGQGVEVSSARRGVDVEVVGKIAFEYVLDRVFKVRADAPVDFRGQERLTVD
jgi:hypothetical protein